MDAAEKHRGRPFTGSGYVFPVHYKSGSCESTTFIIMIALYLPQPHEEGSGSEF